MKKWGDLSKTTAFDRLSPDKQESARQGYFDQRVAPTVENPADLPAVKADWDKRTLPRPASPAAPAANVAQPDSNTASQAAMKRPTPISEAVPQQPTQSTVISRPGAEQKPAPRKGGSGFVSAAQDAAEGVVAGITEDIPKAVAGVLDYGDTPTYDEQGKLVDDDGAASKVARQIKADAEKRGESWQQSAYGKQMKEANAFSPHGSSYEFGRMLPMSFGPVLTGAAVGGMVAGPPGMAVGAAVGGLAAFPLYFGSQAKDSYDAVAEEVRGANPEWTDEQVHDEAMVAGGKTGLIEAGGEVLANMFAGLKIFKTIPGSVKKDFVKASTKGIRGVKPMIADYLKVLGVEVGTELGQGAAQAEVEESYGVGEGATWENQKGVIMPTILMTIMGAGIGGSMSARKRYQTSKILQNPDLPVEQRIKAVDQVTSIIAQEDKELASLYRQHSYAQISKGKPVISEDDRFYGDLKPLEQREVDKKMADGVFDEDETPSEQTQTPETAQTPESPEATGSPETAQTAQTAQTGEEVDDVLSYDENGEVVIDDTQSPEQDLFDPANIPTDAPTSGPAPTPEAAPVAETGPTDAPTRDDITPEERAQTMNDLNASLKVLWHERKAAQKASTEDDTTQLDAVDAEIAFIAGNIKRLNNGERPIPSPRQEAEAAPTPTYEEGSISTPATDQPKQVLQNKDRSTAESIKQMTDISANPDYGRASVSRDFANGAPVVEEGAEIPPAQMGREETTTTAEGRKIPVQYAVVEAEDLLPSHNVDGTPVAEYSEGVDGKSRAIAGNGRVAGITSAFGKGNADNYVEDMAGDTQHGIDGDVIRGMTNPVLVRVMPSSEITDTIGDESNTPTTNQLSPSDQAKTDSKRIDIGGIELDDNGEPTNNALIQFLNELPGTESSALKTNGRPNKNAIDRLTNAIFSEAYESETLLELATEATNPEIANIISGMRIAAGPMSKLKGAGHYDIRQLIVDAAEIAVNAKRDGQSLAKYLEQGDLGRTDTAYLTAILNIMADNSRSAKKLGEQLTNIANVFHQEATMDTDSLFGEVPKRSPAELMGVEDGNRENESAPENTGGAGTAGGSSGGPDNTGVEESPAGEPETGGKRPKKRKKPKKIEKPSKSEGVTATVDAEIDDIAGDLADLLKPESDKPQDLLGDIPVDEQALADKKRELDEKRNGTKDVAADTDGGLFSNQQDQTDLEDAGSTDTLTSEVKAAFPDEYADLVARKAAGDSWVDLASDSILLSALLQANTKQLKIWRDSSTKETSPIDTQARRVSAAGNIVSALYTAAPAPKKNETPFNVGDTVYFTDLTKEDGQRSPANYRGTEGANIVLVPENGIQMALPADRVFKEDLAAPAKVKNKPIVKKPKVKAAKKPTKKIEKKKPAKAPVEAVDQEIDDIAGDLADLLKDDFGTLDDDGGQFMADSSGSENKPPPLNPKVMEVATKLGTAYINKGVYKFKQWSQAILRKLRDLGVNLESLRPHLAKIYGAAQMEVSDEMAEKMDDFRVVRKTELKGIEDADLPPVENEQKDPAPAPAPAPKDEAKKPKKAKKPKAPPILARLKNYFRPNRIVDGYGGPDKVIEFLEGKDALGTSNWGVKVIRVNEDGSATGESERVHATIPSKGQLDKWERENPISGVKKTYTTKQAEAAQKIAIDLIDKRIDGMKASAIQQASTKLFSEIGMKIPVGKASIKAAATDPTIISSVYAAEAFGVNLPADVKGALEAQKFGEIKEEVKDQGLAPYSPTGAPSEGTYFYISSGALNEMYTLRRVTRILRDDGRVVNSDRYVANLSTDHPTAIAKARQYLGASRGYHLYGEKFALGEIIRSESQAEGMKKLATEVTLKFGKHKGKTIAELEEIAPDYIEWLKSEHDAGAKWIAKKDPTLVGFLSKYVIPEPPAPEIYPEEDRKEVFATYGLAVQERQDGKWLITDLPYDINGVETYRSIRSVFKNDANFLKDGDEKGWEISNGMSREDVESRLVDVINKAEAAESEERKEAKALRAKADLMVSDELSDADAMALVSEGTTEALKLGMNFGIPESVVNDQIADTGKILDSYNKEKGVFLLASEAGTGKTFVLGGAIRELREAGAEKFVYVTMNTDLIDQIAKDLKPYGMDDVHFVTYAAISTGSSTLDTEGAVIIFDEVHNVKNVQSARGKRGQKIMDDAEFTVMASATPFENPAQVEYMAGTSFFEREFGGDYYLWVQGFGGSVTRFKGAPPKVAWTGTKADGKAARQFLFDRGIMTQRAMQLPADMVDSNFLKNPVAQEWVDLYERVDSAYENVTEDMIENDDTRDISSVKMHRINVLKRILEASKVQAGIDRAKFHMEQGKNPIIFVETKADRHLGRFRKTKRKGVKQDPKLHTFDEMTELMEDWTAEADAAIRMKETPPPPPFAMFIYRIASSFDDSGIDFNLPSTSDDIIKALGKDNVGIYTGSVSSAKASKNLAEWRTGERKVLVATMDKGGTGLSLHDTVGDHPTAQVNINLPWTGTKVDQVAGRSARYGLQSKAHIEWLFASNIPFEAALAGRVGTRMADMGAVVKGVDVKAATTLVEGFDFEGEVSTKNEVDIDELAPLTEKKETPTPADPTVTEGANESATSPTNDLAEPTVAQQEAGNYKMGHIDVQGLDITVENPVGSVRKGVDEDGSAWEHEMKSHYGYIKKTEGADGDHIDVFVGDNTASDQVFVVDQVNGEGKFDEHKAMLGFDNQLDAVVAYKENYDAGWKVGPVRAMSVAEFKSWLENNDNTKPIAEAKVEPKDDFDIGGQSGLFMGKRAKTEIQDRIAAEDYQIYKREPHTLNANEKKAFNAYFKGRSDAKEIKANLKRLAGTPWAFQATEGILTRTAMRQLMRGIDPNFQTAFDTPAASETRRILKEYGNEGLFKLMVNSGIVGHPAKPEHAVNSSFAICSPTRDCAHDCYALGGNYKRNLNSLLKSEMITEAVARDPKRAADMVAREYKATHLENIKSLRLFDKGDGDATWVPFIEELNRQGVLVHVFSKKPDFLRAVPEKNLRLLSADKSNLDLADNNLDLGVAFVYDSTDQIPAAKAMFDRGQIQVILPIKQGVKVMPIADIKALEKAVPGIKRHVCPIDAGRKLLPKSAAKVDVQGFTCNDCNVGGGIGCYTNQVTEKMFAVIKSKKMTGKEKETELATIRSEINERLRKAAEILATDGSDDAGGLQDLLRDFDQFVAGDSSGRNGQGATGISGQDGAVSGSKAGRSITNAKTGKSSRKGTKKTKKDGTAGQAGQAGEVSTSGSESGLFKRDVEKPKGATRTRFKMTVDDISKAVAPLSKKWKAGPTPIIIQSSRDLPAHVKNEMSKQGLGSVSGYYDRANQNIYLVADGIKSAKDAQVTIFHEAVGHMGLEAVLGEDINDFLRSVKNARESDPVIKAAYEYVDREYADALPVVKASEVIAKISETNPKHSIVQRLMQMIRQAARKLGFTVPFSNNDIIEALRRSESNMTTGQYQGQGGEGNLFQSDKETAPDFYSSLADSASKLKQAKGTPEQMLNAMKKIGGVKEEELEWTGLSEYMEGVGKSITKEQIETFLAGNGVQVESVQYGKSGLDSIAAKYGITIDEDMDGESLNYVTEEGEYLGYMELPAEMRKEFENSSNGPAKYDKASYQLPGGKNYREVLLTLPVKQTGGWAYIDTDGYINARFDTSEEAMAAMREDDGSIHQGHVDRVEPTSGRTNYMSGHYNDIPNVLAQIRLTDRTAPGGKKVLFVEEIQSDWHQAGKKEGYAVDARKAKVVRGDGLNNWQIRWDDGSFDGGYGSREAAERAVPLRESLKGVPDAPFKGNAWVELAAKKILRMAADGGYDSVAWTTGRQQIDRYNLAKVASSVSVIANDNDTYNLVVEDLDGFGMAPYDGGGERVTPDEMAKTIGQEMSEKLIAGANERKGLPWPSGKGNNPAFFTLTGNGLEIGGAGMKSFYDNTLSNVFKKVGRKLDKKATVDMRDVGGDVKRTHTGTITIDASLHPQYEIITKQILEEMYVAGITPEQASVDHEMGWVIGVNRVSPEQLEIINWVTDLYDTKFDSYKADQAGTDRMTNQGIDVTPTMKGEAKLGQSLFRAEQGDTLYHVTFTKNVEKIQKDGISPMKTSNWKQAGSGKRYGNGEIFSFDNEMDALRWAAKMDWEFNTKSGSGEISIVKVINDSGEWDIDTADPMGQLGKKGNWLKRGEAVPAENVGDADVFTEADIKRIMADNQASLPSGSARVDSSDSPAGEEVVTRRGLLRGIAAIAVGSAIGRNNLSEAGVTLGKAQVIPKSILDKKVSKKAQDLFEQGDMVGALNEISETGPAEVQALATQLSELVSNDDILTELVVMPEGYMIDREGVVGHQSKNDPGATGAKMTLYQGEKNNGLGVGTFLHEAAHLAVMQRYGSINYGLTSNFDRVSVPDAKARDALTEFNKLFQEFDSAFYSRRKESGIKYAHQSPDEFFVRALTDPEFQAELAAVSYEGKTLWNRFKDWVKFSLFDMKFVGTDASWLDAALTGANDVIEAMKKDDPTFEFADAFYNKYGGKNQNKELFNRRSESYLDKTYDARMARAKEQGYTQPSYHATTADISEFNEVEADREGQAWTRMGFHFGDVGAATQRLVNKRLENGETNPTELETGANIIPVMLRTGRQLRLPENRTGRWGPNDILQEIFNVALSEGGLDGITEDMIADFFEDNLAIDGVNIGDVIDTVDLRAYVKGLLNKIGYDSIVYENGYENKGSDSYIIFNPEDIRSTSATFDPEFGDLPQISLMGKGKSHSDRMARAESMGFDTSNMLTHITDREFTEFDTNNESIGAVIGSWFNNNPQQPFYEAYTRDLSGKNSIAVYSKAKNLATDRDVINTIVEIGGGYTKRELTDALIKNGFDGYTNNMETAIFNAADIRSIHADFDPDMGDLPNISLMGNKITLGGPDKAPREMMLDELWEKTSPHPFERGTRMTEEYVGIEVSKFGQGIHLSSIISFGSKNQGAGSRGLKLLTDLADKHGISIDATVKPIRGGAEGKSLTKAQLMKWYKKNGFEVSKGDYIVREPQMGDLPEQSFMVDASAKAGKLTPEEVTEWRAANKVKQRRGRVPEVQESAKALKAGEMDSKQYRNIADAYMPIMPIKEVPKLATVAEMSAALSSNKTDKILGVDTEIADGVRTASRLDIPAYDFYNTWVVAVHDGSKRGGKSIAYGSTAVMSNVEFVTNPKAALGIATGDTAKAPFARMHGDWKQVTPEQAKAMAERAMGDPSWTQVGMNPFRHSYFYNKATGEPVASADFVVQVGPLVMAKNAVTTSPESDAFNIKDTNIFFKTDEADPQPSVVPEYHADDWMERTGLSRETIEKYGVLGDEQRGDPEVAMVAAQFAIGGGVLSPVIEHVGDLTNRMSPKHGFDWGYDAVMDKLDAQLSRLESGYGFEREHNENMAANASYNDINLGDLKQKIDSSLKVYGNAHRKLKVHNKMQKLARDAAIALGEQDFDWAVSRLKTLKRLISTPEKYLEAQKSYEEDFDLGSTGGQFRTDRNPIQEDMVGPDAVEIPPEQGNIRLIGGANLPNSDWVLPSESKLKAMTEKWIYHVQNKQIDLKRVQETIKAAGGKILEAYDAYKKETLFHGRSATRVKTFLDTELDPLVAEMIALDVSQEQLGKFLWARHAKEANAHIAKINPELPDGGSGMTDAEADAYMASLSDEEMSNYKDLAVRVDAITKQTRDGMVDDSLISAQDRQTWESTYEFYVPLFRDMGESDDTLSHGMGTGQGYSIKGKEVKRRTGSELPVADIIANITNARDKAVVRGEKARVGRALYALALTHKNPDFWHTTAKAPMMKAHDKDGNVISIPDPMFKQRDHVVTVKVKTAKGKVVERMVVFNPRDPKAMRMAHAIKNLDGQQLGELLSTTASVTRYFAKINTQYNPIFGVVNLVRDSQAAMINLSSTSLAGSQKEVMSNLASIMGGVLKRGGKGFSGKWVAISKEFEAAGGKTGYRDMFANSKERSEDIEKALNPDWWTKRPWGKALTANGYLKEPAVLLADKGVKPVFEWLSDYNDTLENATRLAVYAESREQGNSIEESAVIAKQITTNFNRKGEMALQVGSLYAFFNATVQGISRMGSTFASPAGKRIMAGGVMIGVIQTVMLALAGYDEDEPPEWVRERNLIFPIPGSDGKYATVPMPLGFHVLPNIGRLMTETAMGGDPTKKIASLLAIIGDAFNPLGGSAPIAQILAPTAADPLVALSMNKDWTGKPVSREDYNSLRPTPGYTRSRDLSSVPAVALAQLLNYATGGNEFKQGIVSPTGDQIDYLAGQLTGGVGREAIKLATTVGAIASGDELPTYKIPLVGRAYGSTTGQAPESNRFYNNIRRLNEHQAEVKGLRETKRGNEAMRYIVENPQARLYDLGNKTYNQVKKLRKLRKNLSDNGASKSRLKAVDEQITSAMFNLNEKMQKAG